MPLSLPDDFRDDGASFRQRRTMQLAITQLSRVPMRRGLRLIILVPLILVALCGVGFLATVLAAIGIAAVGK